MSIATVACSGEVTADTASDCKEDVREINENTALWTNAKIELTRELSVK